MRLCARTSDGYPADNPGDTRRRAKEGKEREGEEWVYCLKRSVRAFGILVGWRVLSLQESEWYNPVMEWGAEAHGRVEKWIESKGLIRARRKDTEKEVENAPY